MAIYLDDANIVFTFKKEIGIWCKLTADTLEELHQFAKQHNITRKYFVDALRPYYMISDVKRNAIVNSPQAVILVELFNEPWRKK